MSPTAAGQLEEDWRAMRLLEEARRAGQLPTEPEGEAGAMAQSQQNPGAAPGAGPVQLWVTAPGESEPAAAVVLSVTLREAGPWEAVPMLMGISLGALREVVQAVREAITLEDLPVAAPSPSEPTVFKNPNPLS